VYLQFRVGLDNLGLKFQFHRHDRDYSQLWRLLVYQSNEYCAEMVVHKADDSWGTSAKVSGVLEKVTGHMAQGALKMYRIQKCIMGSFGLDCIFLTEGQYSGSLL